jgi:hypothetical protein
MPQSPTRLFFFCYQEQQDEDMPEAEAEDDAEQM